MTTYIPIRYPDRIVLWPAGCWLAWPVTMYLGGEEGSE